MIRGQMENLIKLHKAQLASDRMSCHSATANLSLEQQARWRDPFRGWREAIEQAGVLVFVLSGAHHQVALEEMRGFAIAEQPLPAIVVNGKDRSPGKTFTLMHELVHVVLGQSAIENELEPGNAILAPERGIETFCNSVAAAVLMPAAALLDHPIVVAKHRTNAAWSDEEIDTHQLSCRRQLQADHGTRRGKRSSV